MAKIKKFKRVEDYLDRVWTNGEVDRDQLAAMHYNDLVDLPEFKGIGARTISNALKAFKQKHQAAVKVEPVSKKKRVRAYLETLLASGELNGESILDINYLYLIHRQEMTGIGKTTISSVLSEYKQRFEKSLLEDNILNFIQKESQVPTSAAAAGKVSTKNERIEEQTGGFRFDDRDMAVLKKMIQQYNHHPESFNHIPAYELKELKSALSFFGIDFQLILNHYWTARNEKMSPVTRLLQPKGTDQRPALGLS